MGASPVQAVRNTPLLASQALHQAPDQVLAKTANVAAQVGAFSSFFKQIDVNRFFVARIAYHLPVAKEDETWDKKRAKNIIRKLKTEKAEPSNDGKGGK